MKAILKGGVEMSFRGNLYGFLGYYNHSKRNYEKALSLYKKAEKLGIGSETFQLSYGVLLLKKGDFEKARDLFSKVLINASKEKIKNISKINLSLAYWKMGQLDTAEEMLREVQTKYNTSTVYGALGYILIEKGDLDEALKYNLEALEYDDEDPVVLDNLAQNYYRMGEIDKAKEYFLKAEQEKSDQPDTLYYLACIYEKEGDVEAARKKLRKALSCNITPLNTVKRSTIEDKLKEIE